MHKLQMYENLMDMLEREVKEIESRGSLDPKSLDILYKIMMSIKAADKHMELLEGKEMPSMSNASGRMSRNSYDSYDSYASRARGGRDGDGDGRYSEDSFRYSQARGSSRDSMLDKLEMMLDAAESEHERQVLMDCIKKIK